MLNHLDILKTWYINVHTCKYTGSQNNLTKGTWTRNFKVSVKINLIYFTETSNDFHYAKEFSWQIFWQLSQLLGDIPGAKRNAFLNTDDMFELGRHAYNLHDWSHSKEWMITALQQPDIEGEMKYNSMDYLSYAEYKVSCVVRWSSKVV